MVHNIMEKVYAMYTPLIIRANMNDISIGMALEIKYNKTTRVAAKIRYAKFATSTRYSETETPLIFLWLG